MKALYMLKFKHNKKWHYKIGHSGCFEYRKKRIKESLVDSKIKAKLHTCFVIKIPFAAEIEDMIHEYLQRKGYRYQHNLPRTVSGWSEYYLF